MLISICMCTYKRAHLLETLSSIAALSVPVDVTIEVIVVDNDEHCSGMKIITEISDTYPHMLIYKSESKKNISAARNMCLSHASGEWIAFIDDDEVADENWLVSLLSTAKKYQAQVVIGRVIATYPKNTPPWIIEGGFFDRIERVTGTEISSGGTGCSLVEKKAIAGQLFDLDFGLSGGEDADFFHRLFIKGHKLVYCQEAIVSEEVEQNRLCIEFLINRKIRIGSSFSKYRYQDKPLSQKIKYCMKNLVLLCGESIVMVLSYPFGKVHHYKWLLKSADRYGKLKYFYHKKIQSLY